ncbi:SDR family oxidoreductase [Nocardia sp. NPDC004123]
MALTESGSWLGEQLARALAKQGFDVILGTRRTAWCSALAAQIGATVIELDITCADSVRQFAQRSRRASVLINSAGTDCGLAPTGTVLANDWQWVWQTTVLGTLRISRAMLPGLADSARGIIVNVRPDHPGLIGLGPQLEFAESALVKMLQHEVANKPVRLFAPRFLTVRHQHPQWPQLRQVMHAERDELPLTANTLVAQLSSAIRTGEPTPTGLPHHHI